MTSLKNMAQRAADNVLNNAHSFSVEKFIPDADGNTHSDLSGFIAEIIEEVINEFGTFDEEEMDYFLTDLPEQDQVTAIAWEIL